MAESRLDPLVFGQRLRHLRRARGLTLEALGALVGRPAPFLSQVETGKREPRLTLIDNLAEALGVSGVAREPTRIGSPATGTLSLIATGTPASGRAERSPRLSSASASATAVS